MAKKKNTKSKSKTSKPSTNKSSFVSNKISTESVAAVLNTVHLPIFMKVCRLCESKDGPFLNIFDTEKITAKKIEELMPFWVAENDDLPHKICFRCSAKVEELYEFVQKCVGTQENLRKGIGKKGPLPFKTNTRALWEQKLNKSNMSNDDICETLIKKAMEGIKDISLPLTSQDIDKPHSSRSSKNVKLTFDAKKLNDSPKSENDDDITLKEIKVNKLATQNDIQNVSHFSHSKKSEDAKVDAQKSDDSDTNDEQNTTNNKDDMKPETTENSKPFDIMDHVSMIKVNGVGVLFQCKLCNRNFLKKDVVVSHACAKSGVPKIDICNMYIRPDPPKVSTIKYINTKVLTDNRNDVSAGNKPLPENETAKLNAMPSKGKKKIGPASRIGRPFESSNIANETQQSFNESLRKPPVPAIVTQQSPNVQTPVFSFPTAPSLTSRYKLHPGPNNTFTLVEDKAIDKNSEIVCESDSDEVIDVDNIKSVNISKYSKRNNFGSMAVAQTASNLSNQKSQAQPSSGEQPYPVGLFQTVPHHSSTFNQAPRSEQVPFTTPAMKKQSYTIVPTGNPNKLLISTKPQQDTEEVQKKRLRRGKQTLKGDANSKESFTNILEDTTPPKDSGFFTFINVDPLLQPSYVLPTNSIIQESQITTSTSIANKETESGTDKDNKYTCIMCGEKFNREKKLNAHMNCHYKLVDEHAYEESAPRKRNRK